MFSCPEFTMQSDSNKHSDSFIFGDAAFKITYTPRFFLEFYLKIATGFIRGRLKKAM